MSIVYDPQCGTFTLHTRHSTYQMKAGRLDYLFHLYYGPTVPDPDLSWQIKQYDRGFSGNPYESRWDRTFSLDTQPQEYSTQQQGDFRVTSLEVLNADGSYSFGGKFAGYAITPGKYKLDTLPATFANPGDEVQTLSVTLKDPYSQVEATLLYAVFEQADIITRAVKVRNAGEKSIRLQKVMSVCLDFLNGAQMDLFTLPGRYAQERQPERQPLTHHIHTVGSVRGHSSHQQNPFVVLCDRDATEDHGNCYGFSLVYSGNFLAEAELDHYDQLRLVMGLHPRQFSWELAPGEVFEAPEVVMAFSANGLTGLSHLYHDFYRSNLCASRFVHARRPVLINSWEAAYMDFDDQKLLDLAKAAQKMGVELLVMDDGWFGKRNDDNTSLGDWTVNTDKLKCGLPALVEQVKALGMQFGIWVEPEMISEDSDLYRAHPDWAMQIPGRPAVRSRNQLALDLTRRDVQDYLIEAMNRVLDSADITYMKWDINRSLSDVWSNAQPPEKQGEVYHRTMLGLYRILENVIKTHPDVLFEGCAGGGGRYDPGMLHYFLQYWLSDNTHALERLRLQYGTSFVYPISTMGAHVSDTGRLVPLKTRAVVAMSGTFGYELDATRLNEDELALCRRQTELFRQYYPLIFEGDYYRLSDPLRPGSMTAWQHVAKDRSEALVSVVVTNQTANAPQEYVRAKGLDPQAFYTVNDAPARYSGAALMYAGLPIEYSAEEFASFQFHLKREKR